MAASKPKRLKVTQRFREEYSKEWPCFMQSKISDSQSFCTVCSCDVSIAHGGRDDCRRHVQSKKHQENEKARCKTQPLASFFQTHSETDVTKAEMLFTSFVVEHNLPVACADHAGPLFRAMFPDSKIAKKYACARTKTNVLIEDMARHTQENIANCLKESPFCLATDGSSDCKNVKLYPIVVTFYNEDGRIDPVLLSIAESTDNTGEGIFNTLNSEFQRMQIPWKNCISFSCDNANTMMGSHKGVMSFLKKVQPEILVQGCSCHLIHLAAKKATAALTKTDVENFLVQLYYYLDKSSKRKNNLKLCQAVCGAKPHKILKYVSTRWLSLLDAVNRVLEQWEALSQFLSEDANDKTSHLQAFIQNPMCKLYCLFLSNTLSLFTDINVFLQQEAPVVHLLHRKLLGLFTDILVRFVKPSSLDDLKSILDIDFKKKKFQKNDSDLVIGAATRAFMKKSSFTGEELNEFYSDVRNFYQTACDYMLRKFPLQSIVLQHAEVADVSIRKKASYSSVEYMVSLFPDRLTVNEINQLESEFAGYQFENVDECSRMDVTWNGISNMTDSCGKKKYGALSKLMLHVLLIPHSNATSERIFSIVRKNQTEFRPSLSTKTLSSLLIEKMKNFSNSQVCYKRTFTERQLLSAKKATRLSLMENKSE